MPLCRIANVNILSATAGFSASRSPPPDQRAERLEPHLYLRSVSCGDVGDGPARLFANGLFRAAQEVQQTRQGGAVQHHLRTERSEASEAIMGHAHFQKHGARPELTCVWMSSPVTMLPTARRAGEATL